MAKANRVKTVRNRNQSFFPWKITQQTHGPEDSGQRNGNIELTFGAKRRRGVSLWSIDEVALLFVWLGRILGFPMAALTQTLRKSPVLVAYNFDTEFGGFEERIDKRFGAIFDGMQVLGSMEPTDVLETYLTKSQFAELTKQPSSATQDRSPQEAKLAEENAALKSRLDESEARMARMEAMLLKMSQANEPKPTPKPKAAPKKPSVKKAAPAKSRKAPAAKPLKRMTVAELKSVLRKEYSYSPSDLKGLKKADLIDEINEWRGEEAERFQRQQSLL